MVVIHFSRLGGRLDPHQKVMLDADAKVIAHVLGYDFGGHHQAAKDYAAPVFFVPDDTLLVDEASSLGIRSPNVSDLCRRRRGVSSDGSRRGAASASPPHAHRRH
jgi:hypothetical protein